MTTRDLWVRSQLVGLRAICVALIALHSFFTRTRMSHENGIVARGRIRLVDDLAIPENDFFLPGREFACRLRHASVSLMDDAGLFVRAASLKFADVDIDSPLDLLMNGGTAAPFWNMHTFAQFMLARMRGGRAHLIPYFQANPRCFENVVSALRLRYRPYLARELSRGPIAADALLFRDRASDRRDARAHPCARHRT
jgi:hypothetical protein